MFSSLASFIFGSNTSANTNSETIQQPEGHQREQDSFSDDNLVCIDAENTIHVTSSTPSVTGSIRDNRRSGDYSQSGKRNKAKRNKNKRQQQQQVGQKAIPTITKLLTPTESCDEDIDEDEWFIVEKESEENSLPRTDSEEELSLTVGVKENFESAPSNGNTQRRRQHINSHSLYSGPRPQQQRNSVQRARNSGTRSNGVVQLNVSTLSLPRNSNVHDAGRSATAGDVHNTTAADTDGIATQSLYVSPSPSPSSPTPSLSSPSSSAPSPAPSPSSSNSSNCGSELGANVSMDESWFVTPPPCFTSIGPINMETSPYENLLIEHPSMSVYYSIRSAQEAAESFVNLDLGVGESRQVRRPTVVAAVSAVTAVNTTTANERKSQVATQQQPRSSSVRSDRFSAAQMKQELFARSSQKSHDKKERQYLCRGAIKRSNKARDFQSRGNRQRRSDMQHCKVISGANNNRKCNF